MTQRVKCQANIRTRVWIPSTHVKCWAWQHVSITPLLRVEMGKILDLAGQLAALRQWPGSVRNLSQEMTWRAIEWTAEVNP